MTQKDIIQEELLELSPTLAHISRDTVYQVPEGYFNSILNQSLILSADQPAFSDPGKDYFNTLPEVVLQKAQINEVDDLTTSDKKPLYTIEAGYFDQLSENVLHKINAENNKSKIISFHKAFRYAAAAVIIGLLGWLIFISTAPFKKENNFYTSQIMEDANRIIQSNTFEKELDVVNENDMVQYLESRGEDINASIFAAYMDNSELPESDAFYYDEDLILDIYKTLKIKN